MNCKTLKLIYRNICVDSVVSFAVRRTLITLFMFFIFALNSWAQRSMVKGRVVDSSAKVALKNASILLLNAKDSFIVDDSRSDSKGIFVLNKIRSGNFIVIVTYPEYVDFVDNIRMDSSKLYFDLGTISLIAKAHLLEDVVVTTDGKAMRFRGDTTEYRADSFDVDKNASVEDLLKVLPGIQVDRDGKITARGKTVTKVLVDGEEFFGDDQTLVTRNLKANMVDKVQLYNKTSDQAAFTGISDGKSDNTLNVKLKKDKKNGYFGKLQLGAGSNKFYENQAMFNSFSGDRKLAAYLTISNTGKIGLDKHSQQSYAGGDSNPISNELDSWDGTYNGIGIPRSVSGGIHYSTKWDEEKDDLNLNYKLGTLNVSGAQNTITQNNLPDEVLYSNTQSNIKNHMLRHGLNAAYNLKLNAMSALKIHVEGSLLHKETSESDSVVSQREDLSKLNSNRKLLSTDGDIHALTANILWQKKFKKERRTFSLNFNSVFNKNKSVGNFYSRSNFYSTTGVSDSSEIVDQLKKTDNHGENYELKATYTEPLSRWWSMVANIGLSAANNKASLFSFEGPEVGVYNILDSIYSNNYEFNQLSYRGGLAYVFQRQKVRLQLGSDVVSNRFTQKNLFDYTSFNRSFTNWYPNTQFNYNINSFEGLTASYTGHSIAPTIRQLQPVLNNSDPLNILVGNPDLVPSFGHYFSGNYQKIKTSGSSFSLFQINGNYSLFTDPMVLDVYTDNTGKSTLTYSNLKGTSNKEFSGQVMNSNVANFWGLTMSLSGSLHGGRYASLSNKHLNLSDDISYEASVGIHKNKKLFQAWVEVAPTYNTNESSLQPEINNNAWGYKISHGLDIQFGKKFQLHSDGIFTWQGKTQTFNTNFSRFLWNVWIAKKFFKKENVLLKLNVNDVLNQNIGLDRNLNNNLMYQNTFTTVSRYLMVSLIWDFNRTKNDK